MKACIYLRVSTQKQNDSHLGIESQRNICMSYIEQQKGTFLSEFSDVESGKSRTRKGLMEAIDYCKKNECTLVIAKLDRLARDVEFTFKIMNTGVDIHFCDMPMVNTMILGMFASVAQYERELISDRTKKALAAKKERGEKTGGACRKTMPDMKKVQEFAAKSKKEKAASNPHNKAFAEFMEYWEAKYGEITSKTDFNPIAEELNKRGKTTSTGMLFTAANARAMYYRIYK